MVTMMMVMTAVMMMTMIMMMMDAEEANRYQAKNERLTRGEGDISETRKVQEHDSRREKGKPCRHWMWK